MPHDEPVPLNLGIKEQGLSWNDFALALLQGEAPALHRYAGRFWVRPAAHLFWAGARRVRGTLARDLDVDPAGYAT